VPSAALYGWAWIVAARRVDVTGREIVSDCGDGQEGKEWMDSEDWTYMDSWGCGRWHAEW
jgi:hypothetical protein